MSALNSNPPGSTLEMEPSPATPKADLKLPFTLPEFTEVFDPLRTANESCVLAEWKDLELSGVMRALIGPDKTTASAAAFEPRCWTVTKLDGKLRIEAGMNKEDPCKVGYIITRKPWSSLDQYVS